MEEYEDNRAYLEEEAHFHFVLNDFEDLLKQYDVDLVVWSMDQTSKEALYTSLEKDRKITC